MGKKHGQGRHVWADKSEYVGGWVANAIEGEGEYRWADGRVYKGEWRASMLHGNGVYRWPDGRRYEGQYIKERKHGYGCYYWPDGKIYEGEWVEGTQHGEGRFTNSKGKSKLGQWRNGERVMWLELKSSVRRNTVTSLTSSPTLKGIKAVAMATPGIALLFSFLDPAIMPASPPKSAMITSQIVG